MPSCAIPRTAGQIISRMMRACSCGVITGAGEYAPMPPVFGPVSPSPKRLWSCFAAQILLNHDARAAIAKQGLNRRVRFIQLMRNDYTFAGGQPVRLDDNGR